MMMDGVRFTIKGKFDLAFLVISYFMKTMRCEG
jgi:hypothetical protein